MSKISVFIKERIVNDSQHYILAGSEEQADIFSSERKAFGEAGARRLRMRATKRLTLEQRPDHDGSVVLASD